MCYEVFEGLVRDPHGLFNRRHPHVENPWSCTTAVQPAVLGTRAGAAKSHSTCVSETVDWRPHGCQQQAAVVCDPGRGLTNL